MTDQGLPSPDVDEGKADCYSDGERQFMDWYQGLRARWLERLLQLLTSMGVRADHLTLVSFVLGLLFCPLVFYRPLGAFACLLLHAAADGLDGPLARFSGRPSRAGSFTDTMSDQLVMVAVTVTMMCHPDRIIGILPGSVYIFLYTIVVTFAMVRNALGIPYSWIVRPRFVIYIWMALELFAFPGTRASGSINFLLWVFNALFLVRMLTGFLKIRARLK